ncbi:MAG: Rieske (2Fe-2S) protein [Chloroflexi bacterium]|nr:Rieske (2Fe-2S) protein [Chloroflexota bacterium]
MSSNYVRAASLADVQKTGCHVAQVDGRTLALFQHQDQVYAVDNRCPHMGFPLDRGTVRDGILVCHWHHARFDLATGGTFDLFADDVPVFPTEMRGGEIWVDLSARRDPRAHHLKKLNDGLEQLIPLVIAKAVIALNDTDANGRDAPPSFAAGLDFGARYRRAGWGQGLTMLTCFANLLPHLDAEDRPLALYHGLSAVAADTFDSPPRFPLDPLPGSAPDFATLKRWFRQFVEVRDGEGAERCIVTAVRAGAEGRQMTEMLFAAATDHRYIQIGHVADFTNKALEALDLAGWSRAELVLASLAAGYVNASRQEESNAWRSPIDLVELLEAAFEAMPAALEAGGAKRGRWAGREALTPILFADDPGVICDTLLDSLRDGATEEELAGAVAHAAALRIARFHTSNEFTDWDTALHTFTFANAVHQAVRRVSASPSTGRDGRAELLRGVFDAAMSVYLDRFLNIPAARLPEPDGNGAAPDALLAGFPALLDRQQMVNEAAALVARCFGAGGDPARILAMLGKLLLREDRDFHTIQTVEAAFRQYDLLKGTREGTSVLIAAARYLAAHSPTVRAEGQTYRIAWRLHRGEKVFEE